MNFNRHANYKESGEGPDPNDLERFDGIHIKKIQDDNPLTNDKYNIQNIITNNVISITHLKVKARYGIYIGDGDDYNFVKNNFILGTRLYQKVHIENWLEF